MSARAITTIFIYREGHSPERLDITYDETTTIGDINKLVAGSKGVLAAAVSTILVQGAATTRYRTFSFTTNQTKARPISNDTLVKDALRQAPPKDSSESTSFPGERSLVCQVKN